MVDLNATQAAIRAGYSEKTAKEIGHENLTKPHIAAAIEQRMGELAEKVSLSADWVIEQLLVVYKRCCDKDTFNAAGANRALELIGKHFNAFPDRKDMHVSGGVNLVDLLTSLAVVPAADTAAVQDDDTETRH